MPERDVVRGTGSASDAGLGVGDGAVLAHIISRLLTSHGVPPVVRACLIAEWLGITERAVRDQMDRGELPWAWQGRQRVVPMHVWMDQLATQAKANEPQWTR